MSIPATVIYFTLYDHLKYAMGYRENDPSTRFIPSFAGALSRGTSREELVAVLIRNTEFISWCTKKERRRNFYLKSANIVNITLASMRYGTNSDLQQFPYKSNTGCTIEERDHLKDLGVTMSRDGTFKKHIQTTVTTAQNQCSWILRTFMTREVLPMLTLWKSLVQCKLDYCSQLWSPTRKGEIQDIEMVQNSFLRKLPAIRHMTYWQKLKQLKLYSQERRRERYTIIYIWRMLEGQFPCLNSLDGGAKVTSIWHIR